MSEKKFIERDNAPLVSSGFRFGSGDELCTVDFLDAPTSEFTRVVMSVALTKKQSLQLIEALQGFIDRE